MADLDFGHVAYEDRNAVLLLEDDAPDVFEIAHQAYAPYQVLLGELREHATAGIGIVSRQGVEHVADVQPVVTQALGIDEGLVLLGETTLRIDLGDTRDRA